MNDFFDFNLNDILKNKTEIIDSGPIDGKIFTLNIITTEEDGVYLEVLSNEWVNESNDGLKVGQVITNDKVISLKTYNFKKITFHNPCIFYQELKFENGQHLILSKIRFSSISKSVDDVKEVYSTIESVTNLSNVFSFNFFALSCFNKVENETIDFNIGNNFNFSFTKNKQSTNRNVYDFNINGRNISLLFCDKFGNGKIIYEGYVDTDYRNKVNDVLSFFLGYKINSISTFYVKNNGHRLGFYVLPKTRSSIKFKPYLTASPVPLYDINSISITNLFNSYDRYNLKHVFWSYFNAFDASIDKAAVYYGSAIEAFQLSYLEKNKSKITNKIIETSQFKTFRKEFIDIVKKNNMDEFQTTMLVNAFNNINKLPIKEITKRFFKSLNLDIRTLEMTAWNRRNDAAHGNYIREDEYDLLFRHNMVLHCLFNRLILSASSSSIRYIDYYTYGFPVRHISSCIPFSAD